MRVFSILIHFCSLFLHIFRVKAIELAQLSQNFGG